MMGWPEPTYEEKNRDPLPTWDLRIQKVSSGWGGKEESSSDNVFLPFFTHRNIEQRGKGPNTVKSKIFARTLFSRNRV